MTLREAESENEMIPPVLMAGQKVDVFDPEFFIVKLGNGKPNNGDEFNILKNYDFPVENRPQQITGADL